MAEIPEPYFDDGAVSLYLGDCREILPALGLTADLIVADPPYEETGHQWDRWPDGWIETAAAVAPSMWCFGSMRLFTKRWAEFTSVAWKFRQDVIWHKNAGTGFNADAFRRAHETVTHWYRGRWPERYHVVPRVPHDGPRRKGPARRTVREQAYASGGPLGDRDWIDDGTRAMKSVIHEPNMRLRGIHPTEKPVGIVRPLLEYACPPGGLVVDPFAGSGSTLEAARLAGRRAIGIEADERYIERAIRRLAQAPLDLTGEEAHRG